MDPPGPDMIQKIPDTFNKDYRSSDLQRYRSDRGVYARTLAAATRRHCTLYIVMYNNNIIVAVVVE